MINAECSYQTYLIYIDKKIPYTFCLWPYNVDKDMVYESHSLQRICTTNHHMQHVDTHPASDTSNVDSLCKHVVHLQLAS